MKAIILAAGKGERLKELTEKVPKPMLRINGEIILEHNLKWLKEYGIEEVFINLHYLPEVIQDYFKNGNAWGIKINYSCEKEILGTAGGVKKIIEDCGWNKWDDDFLLIYGDNLYPFSYNLN
ncbi:MAG: nucleotidyltransferase family protein, partial [Desulfobacteraceae bacterium]|nr:nucleotidyltransferase family protein [Desulfobacteraceae bacterium]